MRSKFPTREQLMAMPIRRLRNIDIAEQDEELVVQEILNAKLAKLPPERKHNVRVPDIKTPAEEKYWQKKIDDANAQAKRRTLKNRFEDSDVQTTPHVLTEGDLEENPELEDEGLKPGDTIGLPIEDGQLDIQPSQESAPEVNQDAQPAQNSNENDENIEGKVRCIACGSKSNRHKKDCPTLLKDQSNANTTQDSA